MYRNAFFAAAICSAVAACAANPDRSPVPFAEIDAAEVSGLGVVRFWGDARPKNLVAELARRREQIRAHRPNAARRGSKVAFLAISGGADDGAFGAGLLAGWTEHGDRPDFEIVTGVSTGALTAPFAFLGPSHDSTLREIYTTYSTDQLLSKQPLEAVFGGSAVADSSKLEALIARYLNRDVMTKIAEQHGRGRRLFIGTTNLDAQRPVIWDMGAIAASGHPDSLKVFRQVILASAAVPGVFPPVNIDVTVDGRHFDEMHVDGGTTAHVFFAPVQLLSGPERKDVQKELREVHGTLYVIRNVKVTPEWQAVEASALKIASRSLSTMMKNQASGDLFKMYFLARELGIKYRLAAVPADFTLKSEELYDPVYMTALFNVGFERARNGYDWTEAPPGL